MAQIMHLSPFLLCSLPSQLTSHSLALCGRLFSYGGSWHHPVAASFCLEINPKFLFLNMLCSLAHSYVTNMPRGGIPWKSCPLLRMRDSPWAEHAGGVGPGRESGYCYQTGSTDKLPNTPLYKLLIDRGSIFYLLLEGIVYHGRKRMRCPVAVNLESGSRSEGGCSAYSLCIQPGTQTLGS